MKNKTKHFFFTTLLLVFVFGAFAQGFQTRYGKNRIQNKNFNWKEYETKNFVTYWYEGGEELGKYVVQAAEKEYPLLQSTLEYRLNEKIQIIVYNNINDFQQTNIGQRASLKETGVFFNSNQGQVGSANESLVYKVAGSKIYLYFNGNHEDLTTQVRKGIAKVFINKMMFGDNFQEIIQNAVLMNFPDWYVDGLVAYIGEEWNADADDKLRAAILSKQYESFHDLTQADPILAGHSLWYFISKNYGKSTVSNLLYLTRINRSVESGFLYVLGSSFFQTKESWKEFFEQRYQQESSGTTNFSETTPLNNPKKTGTITHAEMSPKGDQVAYVKNINGHYEIILHDIGTKKESTILKNGLKTPHLTADHDFPLIAWAGPSLIIVDKRKNNIKISRYNKGKMTSSLMDKTVQHVYSVDAISGKQMVLSLLREGQVDLYLSTIEGKQLKRVTRDIYDDLDARGAELNGEKGILFTSNRPNNNLADPGPRYYLYPRKMDVFFYNLETQSPILVNITDTPYADERDPSQIDGQHFSFLSNENGVMNRYVGKLEKVVTHNEKIITLQDGEQITIHEDSVANYSQKQIKNTAIKPVYGVVATSYPNTNYQQGILYQGEITKSGKTVEIIRNGSRTNIFVTKIDPANKMELVATQYREAQTPAPEPEPETKVYDNILQEVAEETGSPVEEKVVEPPKPAVDKEEKIDIDNYFFQSEFEDDETPTITDKEEKELAKNKETATILPEIIPKKAKKKKIYQPIVIEDSKIKKYRSKFRMEFLKLEGDLTFLGDGFDLYSKKTYRFGDVALNSKLRDDDGLIQYPPITGLFNASLRDVMENHRFHSGFRIPITLDGVDYFLKYENKKKRLDKEFFYYRRSRVIEFQETNAAPFNSRLITNLAGVELSYPLNVHMSVRVTPKIRMDRNTLLATDFNVLDAEPILEQRLGLRAEFVYDNTKYVSINIQNGTRFKVFGEIQKPFNFQLANEAQFNFKEGSLALIGIDARHYFKLDQFSIIATRLAGATSFGKEKVLYYLGAVDNWIFPIGQEPKANTEIPVPENADFAYQTLATNLRGFKTNIRNGNSYAVWNTELRFPMFNYFSKKPVKSAFLRNFQVVGFFDLGTAWEGKSPFSKDNPLNTVYIDDPNKPISVKVNYFRNPIVMGYGLGLRTVVFGGFVKFDYAWGIETGQIQPGIMYLSWGTDF